MEREKSVFLPVSVNITNKKILIIGGGKEGLHKAVLLNRFTSEATVISPCFHEGFNVLPFKLVKKEYETRDIEEAFLVYVCTGNESLNARIKADAEKSGVLANVCDNPVLCDFISPAIYKKENVTIAVSSNARNVYQSIGIRNQIKVLAEQGDICLEIKADD
ncbi:MAG: bifunctional precorrin-2 dehydrogenase/sirohydrochlorin ferrochelatase [Tannerella sp.]|jgi:siroheme synthase-like protein|nr:bifunctional precorrin-2 dehydrogenase/sirohydrochlorin ferrochelatase [Tannerella sp.]